MSNIDKQALRERYSLKPVPKCHICDAVMTIARASAGAVMYACSGCTYDDNGAHYASGRSLGDDHYSASRVTIFESGDPEVLALLDELETKEEQRANWFQMAQKLGEDLDAAEKRIAELEAVREVFLRAKALMYQSGGAPIENSLNPIDAWLYDAELTAAGIGVKGG